MEYHISKSVCVSTHYDAMSLSDNKCKYCGKVFTTATNMYRHMNHTCRIKKNEGLKRDKIYERLLELEKNNVVLLRKTEENKKCRERE